MARPAVLPALLAGFALLAPAAHAAVPAAKVEKVRGTRTPRCCAAIDLPPRLRRAGVLRRPGPRTATGSSTRCATATSRRRRLAVQERACSCAVPTTRGASTGRSSSSGSTSRPARTSTSSGRLARVPDAQRLRDRRPLRAARRPRPPEGLEPGPLRRPLAETGQPSDFELEPGGVPGRRGDVLAWDIFSPGRPGAARRREPLRGLARQARDRQRRVAVRRAPDHATTTRSTRCTASSTASSTTTRGGPCARTPDEPAISVATEWRQPHPARTYPDTPEPPALGGRRDLARGLHRHALRRRRHRARHGRCRAAGDADRA